jgi:hypothetical protein
MSKGSDAREKNSNNLQDYSLCLYYLTRSLTEISVRPCWLQYVWRNRESWNTDCCGTPQLNQNLNRFALYLHQTYTLIMEKVQEAREPGY